MFSFKEAVERRDPDEACRSLARATEDYLQKRCAETDHKADRTRCTAPKFEKTKK